MPDGGVNALSGLHDPVAQASDSDPRDSANLQKEYNDFRHKKPGVAIARPGNKRGYAFRIISQRLIRKKLALGNSAPIIGGIPYTSVSGPNIWSST